MIAVFSVIVVVAQGLTRPQSRFDTGNRVDIDPTDGFVNYTTRAAAEHLGLIATQGTEVFVGVDHATQPPHGRNSVRLESKKSYNSGLFIAKFSHFPQPACGAWPAFWMFGPQWPKNGELDIYEGWNLVDKNTITAHTTGPTDIGSCKIKAADFIGAMETDNCDINAPGQYTNQGCGVKENNGLWGNAAGGVCK